MEIVVPTIGTVAGKMIKFDFKTGWLTLNRDCNLRCKLCYARETGFKKSLSMDIELAKKILDLFKELGIKNVTLIGGEPTLHPYFFEIADYCNLKGMRCGVVTNAVVFNNDKYIRKIVSSSLNHVSISIKGENRDVYKSIAGSDQYNAVLNAIDKLIKNNISVSTSMVLTDENILTFTDIIPALKKLGVSNFYFSFCYDFNMDSEKRKDINPFQLLNKFRNIYPKLNKLTNGRFKLQNGFPLCCWDEQLLKILVERKQIATVCQLLGRKGLIFDSEGYHIPCNAMYKLQMGKFGVDFNDKESFLSYLDDANLQEAYSKLCGIPDSKCLDCKKLVNCGGGCVCQWTNYRLAEYEKMNQK